MVKISKLLSDEERGIKVKSSKDYIQLSRKGLTMRQMKQILAFSNISVKEISSKISISERQLLRYSDDKVLRKDLSAHLIQIAELYGRGYEVFEEEKKFQKWMHSEIRALAYQKPIELIDTPFGIEDIKNILGRLEHGVYS